MPCGIISMPDCSICANQKTITGSTAYPVFQCPTFAAAAMALPGSAVSAGGHLPTIDTFSKHMPSALRQPQQAGTTSLQFCTCCLHLLRRQHLPLARHACLAAAQLQHLLVV
jgi:hypothetical protein